MNENQPAADGSSATPQMSAGRRLAFTSLLVVVLWVLFYLLLVTVGYALIRAAYHGTLPIAVLNRAITGQAEHDVSHYTALARSLYLRWSLPALAGYLLLLPLLRPAARALRALTQIGNRARAAWLTTLSILLLPPAFSARFAVGPLFPEDRAALWACSLTGLAGAVFLSRKVGGRVGRILPVVLLVVSAELLARAVVGIGFPAQQAALNKLGNQTYPDRLPFQAHPFLLFTGKPSSSYGGNEYFGGGTFNNYGFTGRDFVLEKGSNVLRIAALGGSTTADGYPAVVERMIAAKLPAGRTCEVFNFGMGWFNSAQSAVNFILNVVDFQPDFVLLHDGWNDSLARDTFDRPFRGDYAHALKGFSPAQPRDRWLIRVSVLWRLVYLRLNPHPWWSSLDAAIAREKKHAPPQTWANAAELKPFERNEQTIIDVARTRGIRVVLVTQPYSTTTGRQTDKAPHIAQCNAIARRLYERNPETLLVDLDAAMTGKYDPLFVDLGHLNAEGIELKARLITEALWPELRQHAAVQ